MPNKQVIEHLVGLYAASEDPWNHHTSAYEAAKYRETLATIGPGPFHLALEIGCGNGSLARLLAPRCERLIVMDCIPAACTAARKHLAGLAHVSVLEGTAPDGLPAIWPDLIVLSEVLYFMTPAEIARLAEFLRSHARGPIIAVNWTGPTDEPLDGPHAVALLAQALGEHATRYFDGYRIDWFSAY